MATETLFKADAVKLVLERLRDRKIRFRCVDDRRAFPPRQSHGIFACADEPKLLLKIVDGPAMHVDLSGAQGSLWDEPTTSHMVWGLRDAQVRSYGRVEMKNGTRRSFWGATLITPSVATFHPRHAELVPSKEQVNG